MNKIEATHAEFVVMLLEKILCRNCKHLDKDEIHNLEICTKCGHYTASKFEYNGE